MTTFFFSISVIGRRDGESELIKEESVIMDPVAPDFDSHNATVLSSHTNITLRALKPEKAIQVNRACCLELPTISYMHLIAR